MAFVSKGELRKLMAELFWNYYEPGSGASFFLAGLGLSDRPKLLAFVVEYFELK